MVIEVLVAVGVVAVAAVVVAVAAVEVMPVLRPLAYMRTSRVPCSRRCTPRSDECPNIGIHTLALLLPVPAGTGASTPWKRARGRSCSTALRHINTCGAYGRFLLLGHRSTYRSHVVFAGPGFVS